MGINGHTLNGSSHHMLGALKTAVRDAILVILALPDVHDPHRFQLRSVWLPVADDGSIDFPAVLDLSNQALEQLSMTVGDRHKIPRATADQLGPFTGSPQHA